MTGNAGSNGISAFAFVLDNPSFVVVAGPGLTTINVSSSIGFVVGQTVIVAQAIGGALAFPGPAHFTITSIPSTTQIIGLFLALAGDVVAGTAISLGAGVSPSGSTGITYPVSIANGGTGSATAAAALSALGIPTPFSVANGGTASTTAATAAKTLTARYRCLSYALTVNFNTTADLGIGNFPAKYVLRKIIVTNGSTDFSAGTVPLGGVYTGAAKTGTVVVAATQSYAALTAAAKFLDLTLEAVIGTDVLAATLLYFSLTTAHGAAGTADIYFFGEDLS